ncbi:sporulation integral membrane protein YtvI [Bacillus lacus]|uniref:Sporulation integral membrane protein YtvI n=1 Tax=Metabacillus lacus TaxID=1983721 RepID=A0A7X2LZB0_9BACI|nr:sporulation integral membrane protein YtvI [Metabacillus lacus]MRX71752.1 sporulation integral membrane protein YtvI [Metabacillus lacus]
MNVLYLQRAMRGFIVAVFIIAGLYACYHLFALTYPFVFGIIIAFMINPLIAFIEDRTKMPRGAAVFIVLILLVAIIGALLTLLVAEIVSGTTYLAGVVPQHFETLVIYFETIFARQIIPFYERINSMFDDLGTDQQETILANIQNVGEQVASNVGAFIRSFLENIPLIIAWLPNAATVIIFSLLATFFISKDWYKLQRLFGRFLPGKAKKSGKTVFEELKKALFGFVKAQATLISITTVIVLAGLLILRVEYAITIALLIGLVDLLPYLGTGLVFVPWIVYLALSGSLPLAIGLGILYMIVLIQRQLMEPKILSSNIGLDPLATLIALFVGFKLIGFLGLLIGPVVVVIINTLYKAGVFYDIWGFIMGKKEV